MIAYGEDAARFAVPASIDARRGLLDRLRATPGVRDVVLCEEIGCVVFAPRADREGVRGALARPVAAGEALEPARHLVRVVYDGEDLDAVARAIGRGREEVSALHAAGEYRVAMLGFLPGFAYLRGLAPSLCLPRRAPRPRVPARSVAIGAEYTGIYPVASAGGWHLLGRALDAPRFALGDVVRFSAAEAVAGLGASVAGLGASVAGLGAAVAGLGAPVASLGAPVASLGASAPRGAHLVVTRMAGLALFVDGGRPGRMHEGMPRGGPLVASRFARANALAGGPLEACAIEVTGAITVEARGGDVAIADDERRVVLRDSEGFTLASGATRARYLALAGGIDAPVLDGGRGALLAAGIGRPLRRGDLLAAAGSADGIGAGGTSASGLAGGLGARGASSLGASSLGARGAGGLAADDLGAGDLRADGAAGSIATDAAIALLPGPDATPALLDAIAAAEFTVSPTSDRTGTRLVRADGATPLVLAEAAAAARPSAPMIEGAIELTPSGLVVLGPDHPTTGGYPVVAVLARRSRDAFFARALGARVRFRF